MNNTIEHRIKVIFHNIDVSYQVILQERNGLCDLWKDSKPHIYGEDHPLYPGLSSILPIGFLGWLDLLTDEFSVNGVKWNLTSSEGGATHLRFRPKTERSACAPSSDHDTCVEIIGIASNRYGHCPLVGSVLPPEHSNLPRLNVIEVNVVAG